jgi:hypothetical protein
MEALSDAVAWRICNICLDEAQRNKLTGGPKDGALQLGGKVSST